MGAGLGAGTGGGGGEEGVEGEQKMQTKTVKLGEVKKIMPPLKERTHCPWKHVCMKSNTQGQCVHMKKRIVMIPRSALLKQQCENAQSMQKKNRNVLTYHCWWQ